MNAGRSKSIQFWTGRSPVQNHSLRPLKPQPALTGDSRGKYLTNAISPTREGLPCVRDRHASVGTPSRPVSTVRLTMNGVIGYDVIDIATHLLFVKGEARSRLLRTEESYRPVCIRGWMSRYVGMNTVTNDVSCITTCCGLDNTSLLPPFFPTFRAEDTLWGVLLVRSATSAVSMYLPEAIYHFPIEIRSRHRDHVWRNAKPRMLRVLATIVDGMRPGGNSCAENLRRIGNALTECTVGSSGRFRSLWSQVWVTMCRKRLDRIEFYRSLYNGSPDYWDRDIVAHAAQIRTHLSDPNCGLPEDFRVPPEHAGDRWSALQDMVKSFGDLLQEWPSIWEAARRLHGAHL